MNEATEVREQLDELQSRGYGNKIADFNTTIEAYAREVVEDGSFFPPASLEVEASLTLKERLTGTRTQDVTAIMCIGMMLGAALERDVPAGSDAESEWRDGEFTLPGGDGQ